VELRVFAWSASESLLVIRPTTWVASRQWLRYREILDEALRELELRMPARRYGRMIDEPELVRAA
jgi:hypothetical protein